MWLTGTGVLILIILKVFTLRTATHELPDLHLHTLVDPQVKEHLQRGLKSGFQGCDMQVKPWFTAGKRYEKIQLVFYMKPVMQALRRICVEKGWRMSLIIPDGNVGAQELRRLTSDPLTFTIIYTTSRAFHHSVIRDLSNSTNALVSAIRYAFSVTGAKKGQLIAFRSFFNRHGCNLRDLGIMPPSFLLDDPGECTQFFKYSQLRPLSWWILKPSKGYGGEGITIHKNMSHFYKNYAVCSQTEEQLIVQEYLSNLLLVEGRKFDVRAFVLIAGTSPYILFYHEGYLRLSMVKFDSKEGGNSVHLTNSHIQTQTKNFSVDKHYWSFQRFQDYLGTHHPMNRNFVSDRLEPFIKKVGLFILQAGKKVTRL